MALLELVASDGLVLESILFAGEIEEAQLMMLQKILQKHKLRWVIREGEVLGDAVKTK